MRTPNLIRVACKTVTYGALGFGCFGCSSSSSPEVTPNPDASRGADSSSASDGSVVDSSVADSTAQAAEEGTGTVEAAGPCVPIDPNIDVGTFDSGSSVWSCLQSDTVCGPELVACGADCVCNNAILRALTCVSGGGSNDTCFINAFTAIVAEEAGPPVGNCLHAMGSTCQGGSTTDGGTDANSAGDAGGD
jgi:hypothetical protein